MAAKKTYTIGLSKIEVGAIAEDGGMGETLDVLGYTYQDTCTMTQEDPETTDHYAEEVDDPVISISRGGKTNFNFSIMNPSVTVLADLLGGVGTPGTGSTPDKWEAPDKIPVVEKSVRITPEQGLKFATFSKSGILLIEVAGTVLQPTKTGTKKITATLMTAADVQA